MDAVDDIISSEEEPYQDSGSEYLPSDEDNTEERSIQGSSLSSQNLENRTFQNEQEATVKPKKRIRHEDLWKRILNKKKRTAGEEYITKSGKIVSAKTFKPYSCLCKNKCHLLIPPARQEVICKNFYSLETFDLQSSYLFSLIRVVNKSRTYCSSTNNPKREKTRLYYLPDEHGNEVKICKMFFKSVLQVSDGRLDRVLKNKSIGATPPVDKRGKHIPANKTPVEKIATVKQFIEKFPTYESHYGRQKSGHRKYLAPDLSLGKLYEIFKNETTDPVSFYIFRKVFNTQYNLHFHAPVTDSCKKCDLFEMQIKSATEPRKKQLETDREVHQRKAESARNGLKKDTELAKENKNVTVICFDLMKTLPTPVLSTGICYYKRQLWTYCLGVHNMGSGDVHMFVWHEGIASRGPQEIGSCLLYYIKHFVKSKKLVMYSDQCGGQNRNIKMSVLCNYIVSSPDFVVDEIHHKFLVSGHSYLPCDQDFGLVEKQKKFHSLIFVPEDWIQVIEAARKKNPFQVITMTSADFFSTKSLEMNVTNRKMSTTQSKVEWLKIQWLHFEKENPFDIEYKYSNNDTVPFEKVHIKKRKSLSVSQLELLYPNGHHISVLKKEDLLVLKSLIPPIHHSFYEQLRTSATYCR